MFLIVNYFDASCCSIPGHWPHQISGDGHVHIYVTTSVIIASVDALAPTRARSPISILLITTSNMIFRCLSAISASKSLNICRYSKRITIHISSFLILTSSVPCSWSPMISSWTCEYLTIIGITRVCAGFAFQRACWRHEIETPAAIPALCEGNPLITGGPPDKGKWGRR